MAHAARVAVTRPSLVAAHVAVIVLALEAVLALGPPLQRGWQAPCVSLVCQQPTARRLPNWRRWRDANGE